MSNLLLCQNPAWADKRDKNGTYYIYIKRTHRSLILSDKNTIHSDMLRNESDYHGDHDVEEVAKPEGPAKDRQIKEVCSWPLPSIPAYIVLDILRSRLTVPFCS